MGECGLGSTGSQREPRTGYCEYANEFLDSIICGQFLDYLDYQRETQLLKVDAAKLS